MEITIKLNDDGQFEVSGDMDAGNAVKALALLFKSICNRNKIPPYLEYGNDAVISIPFELFKKEAGLEHPPFVLQAQVKDNSLDLQTWCSDPYAMVKGLLAMCKWNHTVLQNLIGFHDTAVLQAFVALMKQDTNISMDNVPLGTGDLLRKFVNEIPMYDVMKEGGLFDE